MQSHRVELYVVVSHRAEGGQDLGEGRHDQVLAVSARSRREGSNYISGTLLRNTQLFSQWYDARASFRIIFMGNRIFFSDRARERGDDAYGTAIGRVQDCSLSPKKAFCRYILVSFAGIDVKRSPASYVRMRYLLGWTHGIDLSTVYALSNGVMFGFPAFVQVPTVWKELLCITTLQSADVGDKRRKKWVSTESIFFYQSVHIILEELKLIQNG